ncbi:uncharacterized protein LOC132794935 [Drosophila nasuta]|uniref:uncharacterized protein LOC132794935 n=1 Tax=Drosophila nasuta TaxID=42062 RepID=UPI00295E5135|nr:uncharacterized protein LOC132794935 [Drosophila nasuta]XP_060661244.1 uncharacterized protein LOC132794935 [Drosophila nasuta]XP_060661245.1 uncharacterized protein LOC132794935 [Drosophila nasuta]XP_060661246.1 uncharacterized protein LOC132794935 [Drosophila nasuta]
MEPPTRAAPHQLLRKCQRFLRLTAEKRLRAVLINKYCSNCRAHQHSGQSCRSAGSCRVCQKDHHTLMHLKEARSTRPSRQRRRDGRPEPNQSSAPARSRSRSPSPHRPASPPPEGAFPTSLTSLLQGKAVSILPIDTGCKTFEMRALIDPCTATSRISASLAMAYRLSVTRVGTEGVCTAIIPSRTSNFRRKVLVDSQLCRRTPLRPVDGDKTVCNSLQWGKDVDAR